jgi:hypothetical protein
MPLAPVVAGALLSGGAGLLGGFAGNASTARQNRLNREFARETYDKQRRDALADRAFENEYNSPAAQMARLKAAGLNPNLVYGNGATTNGVSTNTSQTPSYRGEAADWSNAAASVGQAANSYFQWQNMQAEQDRIKALTRLAEQDSLVRTEQILSSIANRTRIGVQTEQDKQNLKIAQQLEGTTLEAARLNVEKLNADINQTKANTQFTLNSDDRAAAQNVSSLKEAVERILTSRLQRAKTVEEIKAIKQAIKNAEHDGTLKRMDIDLRKKGIMPSDNVLERAAQHIFDGTGLKTVWKAGTSIFKHKFGL